MSSPESSSKPKVLCLHGEGTSAEIFRIQIREIVRRLGSDFDFVFVNAPFTTVAGEGVADFFPPPYYNWILPGQAAATWEYLDQKIAELGPFVGIVAFSQGCRVTTALLQRQAIRESAGEAAGTGFLFAVLLAGTVPPLPLVPSVGADPPIITVPTVHVHGSQDRWLWANMELLETFYDGGPVSLIEHDGGHHFPRSPAHAANVVDCFKRAYSQGLAHRTK
jgi:pimeloyl-ACP methyl ester carboxylesterase